MQGPSEGSVWLHGLLAQEAGPASRFWALFLLYPWGEPVGSSHASGSLRPTQVGDNSLMLATSLPVTHLHYYARLCLQQKNHLLTGVEGGRKDILRWNHNFVLLKTMWLETKSPRILNITFSISWGVIKWAIGRWVRFTVMMLCLAVTMRSYWDCSRCSLRWREGTFQVYKIILCQLPYHWLEIFHKTNHNTWLHYLSYTHFTHEKLSYLNPSQRNFAGNASK